jgi:hypothetical protein
MAADREVAADEVEQEGRQLRQEVVQELHRELQLIESKADVEDLPRRPTISARSKFDVSWTRITAMPSTHSAIRPASWRAVS